MPDAAPPPVSRSVAPSLPPRAPSPPVPPSPESPPVEPEAEPLPSAPPSPAAGDFPPALSSATLAELYFSQGFVEKAAEVYEQLLQREPGNERMAARLAELKAIRAGSSRAAPEAPPRRTAEGERAERRRAIEGRIARLEELLAAVRRHAPAGGTR